MVYSDRLDSMVSETSGQLEQLEQILAAFKVSDGGECLSL